MFTEYSQSLTRAASVLLFVGLLAGCAGSPIAQVNPTAPSAPTVSTAASPATPADTAKSASGATAAATSSSPTNATPVASAELDEATVKEGIQTALDLYAQAYNENKPELLQQAADQTNAPFRRFIQTRFQFDSEAGNTGQGGFRWTAQSIKQRDFGFWQAQVIDMRGAVTDWTFRQLDGRWVMSEPTADQLGKKQTIQTEHFTFFTYPWSNDVNKKLIDLMEKARQNVLDRLGKVPDQKAEVTLKPIYGVGRAEDPGALAYYDRSTGAARGVDKMVIFAPGSYVFEAYDPGKGWESLLETILTHEYTHLVNNRSFTPLVRENDWMIEGLAVYISQDTRYDSQTRQAVATDSILPIVDPKGGVDRRDLETFTILPKAVDVSLGYGLSKSLVTYITETYGGLDGYWKLVGAYDKSQKFDIALQQAFGVSYDQFDKGWRAWLKGNY